LAPNATVFTNSFATTPICAPSRASLFTGLYAHDHGVLHVDDPWGGFENFNDASTLATWLDSAGYNTAMVGKYINGYDLGTYANRDPNNTYVPPGWDYWRAMLGATYTNPNISVDGVTQAFPKTYATDVLTDLAVQFIDQNKPSDGQPFFLYYAPHNPHTPAIAAPRHTGAYDNLEPFRPPSFNEADISDKPAWVANQLPLLTASDIAAVDQFREDQLESMLSVDEGLGRMMQALRETNQLNNTIIIYTSDNGQMWGEHRFVTKGPAWEESIRVPLLVYDGRHPVSQVVDELALNIDLAPTIMAYAGLSPAQPVDGKSLLPLINNQTVTWRDDFLVEKYVGDGGRYFSLRTTRYSYTEWANGSRELYDLQKDPYELTSVHNDPAYATVKAQLSARLNELKPKDVTAPVLSNIQYRLNESGSPVLTMTLSDAATGGSQVRGAEYYIGTPGNSGGGTPMRPVDGMYDSVTESIIVDLPAMAPGSYNIYVNGRDIEGNWASFVAFPIQVVANNQGLSGQYYNETNLTALATTRVDATVNFPKDWGAAPAGTAVTADDKYSVRWSGYVQTPTAGNWTFYTSSDDGVRLWIDNKLVIDNWTTHAVTQNSGVVSLTAGWHAIRLEYFQQGGVAAITLSYQGPGQVKAIIPQARLRTTVSQSVVGMVDVASEEAGFRSTIYRPAVRETYRITSRTAFNASSEVFSEVVDAASISELALKRTDAQLISDLAWAQMSPAGLGTPTLDAVFRALGTPGNRREGLTSHNRLVW
jgi:arylsulfatase A-like enzyme